ncbi:PH domain-containing protein [Spirochaeta africana]|uniref:Putative membrane protein n=1 Tax=Spirochaeta africana (strain ATCC 700263 / DSM 8902 / Z-7692) TaxID=889378 RepID=H9UFG7_SPIAZ|nr:PH domain-containing protein [Spirochaeta africana]AFG36260.1 putative membrane protein [Spirochaeta africana DSM 8902]
MSERLHWYAIVHRSVSATAGIIPFLLIPIFLTSPEDFRPLRLLLALGFLIALLLPALGWNTVWWRRFRYSADSGGIQLTWGIVIRRQRSAALDRIQRVTTTTGPVMRRLGVTSLHIETAGGSEEPEIHLPSVSREEARRLQQLLSPLQQADGDEIYGGETSASEIASGALSDSGLSDGVPAATIGDAVASLSPDRRTAAVADFRLRLRDMIIAGFTSGGALAILGVLIVAYVELRSAVPEEWEHRVLALFPNPVWAAAAILAVLLAISWCIASLLQIEAFWGFHAVRRGGHISIRRGLISERTTELDVSRIHAVTVVEAPLRALLGRATVKLQVAGQSGSMGMDSAKLLPIVPRTEIPAAISALLPEYAVEQPLTPLPPSAFWGYLLRGLPTAVLLAAAGGYFLHPLFWLFPMVALLWAFAAWRDGGMSGVQVLALRRRLWSRRTMILHRRRVQAVEELRSPLQRLLGLASLRVYAAAGSMTVHGLALPTVSRAAAWVYREQG